MYNSIQGGNRGLQIMVDHEEKIDDDNESKNDDEGDDDETKVGLD